jgi:hypothetical protein
MRPVRLVPIGEVYYQLDKKMRAGQFPGKSDIVSAAYADGIHQNDFGNYIVGCTYFSVMFHESPTGFSGSRYGVTGTSESIIQQTVWQVVSADSRTGMTVSNAHRLRVGQAPVTASRAASEGTWSLSGKAMGAAAPARSLRVALDPRGVAKVIPSASSSR